MGLHTFGAIYIGSYEVSLKIFEISAKRKIRQIDYVRTRIGLGRDTYTKGSIGSDLVEKLCDTLGEFVSIMEGYRVDHYEACAALALRDADNELFVLDQIKIRTGISVRVLSNAEQRFISYKSIAMRDRFEELTEKGAAVVDVSGNSMQITIFSKGKVVTTQHLSIGAIRMQEQLAKKSSNLAQYELQMEELVEKQLGVFQAMYMGEHRVKYLIIMGEYITEIVRKVKKKPEETVTIKDFHQFLERLRKKDVEHISEELGLSNENDALLLPYVMIFQCVVAKIGAEELWAPGSSISDGIAYDYAQRERLCKISHDFEADILSAARSLAERYRSYPPHIEALSKMSVLIFDAMKKIHGLGKRERLLLQVAAILHDCGKYISFSNAPLCSYDIVMASEIIGLSHLERQIVAYTVLYNTYPLAPYEELADRLDQGSYLVVAKLSAILRVSNAMDRSNKQKFKNVRAAVRGKELVITIEADGDITLEKVLFGAKIDYFERIFSVKPVIREKR